MESLIRVPKVGDIWLVNYPYITPGNMEKKRPAIIRDISDKEDYITVQKLTTKYHEGNKIFHHPKMKYKTYISQEKVKVQEYRLIRYIGNIAQERNVKK